MYTFIFAKIINIWLLMKDNYIIRVEEKKDYNTVENLTRDCFWNIYRPGCTEHYVLHCYRDNPDFIPELSLVISMAQKVNMR